MINHNCELNVDLNEIETIAHYTAAKKFEPKVTSIVDIGGQDMKYIKLKNKAIDNKEEAGWNL